MNPTTFELFMYAAENFYTLCTVRDASELAAEKARMDEAWTAYLQEQDEADHG